MKLISSLSRQYPAIVKKRLQKDAPKTLTIIGNENLLAAPKTALLCSTKCPGMEILKACDMMKKWRDSERCIISGFHSPMEKECLEILLRGTSPLIISPAREIAVMKIPVAWKPALDSGRLLILSPFDAKVRRQTSSTAERRNEFVAAMADKILIIHATPGGAIEKIQDRAKSWGVPLQKLG